MAIIQSSAVSSSRDVLHLSILTLFLMPIENSSPMLSCYSLSAAPRRDRLARPQGSQPDPRYPYETYARRRAPSPRRRPRTPQHRREKQELFWRRDRGPREVCQLVCPLSGDRPEGPKQSSRREHPECRVRGLHEGPHGGRAEIRRQDRWELRTRKRRAEKAGTSSLSNVIFAPRSRSSQRTSSPTSGGVW